MFSATTTTTARVPIEIVERIIDLIEHSSPDYGYASWDADVLPTLQSCALVCRAWLLRCRHHLFRAVGIRCVSDGARTLDDFVALLDRHASLQPYVRVVSARAGPSAMSKLHLVPHQLPGCLPELEHLHMEGGALYVPAQMALDAMMRRFATVGELSFGCLGFYSVHDLRRTVASLRRLRMLVISSPSWVTVPPTRPLAARYRPSPVRLDVLSILSNAQWVSDPRSVYFVRWLTHSGVVSSLKELDLRHMIISKPTMLEAVTALLTASKTTLREIDISLGPDIDLSPRTSHFRYICAY